MDLHGGNPFRDAGTGFSDPNSSGDFAAFGHHAEPSNAPVRVIIGLGELVNQFLANPAESVKKSFVKIFRHLLQNSGILKPCGLLVEPRRQDDSQEPQLSG
jgi:hypothetical protein